MRDIGTGTEKGTGTTEKGLKDGGRSTPLLPTPQLLPGTQGKPRRLRDSSWHTVASGPTLAAAASWGNAGRRGVREG